MKIEWTTSPTSGHLETQLGDKTYRLRRTGSHRWTVSILEGEYNPAAGTYGQKCVLERKTKHEATAAFATFAARGTVDRR